MTSGILYGGTTTRDTEEQKSLTMNAILAAKALMPGIVWYTTSRYIEPGKCYELPATQFTPKMYAIAEDDETSFLFAAEGRCIVRHIHDYKIPMQELDLNILDYPLPAEDFDREQNAANQA